MSPASWDSTRAVWRAHPGYVMAWAVNIAVALYVGGTGLFTAPTRFSAPTFDGLRDSLGVHGWSAAIFGYGLLLVLAAWLSARSTMLAFWAGAAVYIAIGGYFASALLDPHASPWGPVFIGIGLWQVTQAEAYRQSLRHAGPAR